MKDASGRELAIGDIAYCVAYNNDNLRLPGGVGECRYLGDGGAEADPESGLFEITYDPKRARPSEQIILRVDDVWPTEWSARAAYVNQLQKRWDATVAEDEAEASADR